MYMIIKYTLMSLIFPLFLILVYSIISLKMSKISLVIVIFFITRFRFKNFRKQFSKSEILKIFL